MKQPERITPFAQRSFYQSLRKRGLIEVGASA